MSRLFLLLSFCLFGLTANADETRHTCDKTDAGWERFATKKAFTHYAMAEITPDTRYKMNALRREDGLGPYIEIASELPETGEFFVVTLDIKMKLADKPLVEGIQTCMYPLESNSEFVSSAPDWWDKSGQGGAKP